MSTIIVVMIERLQKLSAEIFKAALKTHTSKEVLAYKRAHANNLTEIFSLFPNQGVGFHAIKKSWAPSWFYEIKRADFKSYRHGHFYGVKCHISKEGNKVQLDKRPVRLHGLNKRGIWTYSVGDFEQCKVNNGVTYNKADIEAFIRVRGIGVTKQVQPAQQEDPVQQAEEGETAEQE